MNFEWLEERLSSYGSGGYYLLETFLIRLLALEAESHGQTVVTPDEKFAPVDAYAPNGIGELTHPLRIEVTYSLNSRKLKELTKVFDAHKNIGDYDLLIVAPRSSNKKPPPLPVGIIFLPIQVHIWGMEKIQELLDKHKAEVESLLDNLLSIRFKMAVTRDSKDWRDERKSVIAAVSEQFKSGRFSLMLGAGVSSSAGLPDWDTLLNSLFVSMLADENLSEGESNTDQVALIVQKLRSVDGPSALMLARYVRKGMASGSPSEQNGFIEAITKQLYTLRDESRSIESDLISSIAGLCTPTRTGARVRSILTYNFDDLIERALTNRGLDFRSIFEEFETPSAEELPVYHVHGFLPEDRSAYVNLDRTTMVFSEEGYHHIYGEAYHWSNLVQLSNLKDTSCLLIGLSLTDPNLRRLLEISAKSLERPKHFAFMRRLSEEKFLKEERGKTLKISREVLSRFLERHHSLNEELLKELGVNVIWYESYDEIPEILDSIRKGRLEV